MKPTKRRVVLVAIVLVIVTGTVTAAVLFQASSGVSYETDSGLIVATGSDHDVSDTNPFLDNETLQLNNVTFQASGPANVTVDQFEGTRTNLSAINASSYNITVSPNDKSNVTISGDVTALDFEDARLDGTEQLTYSASGPGEIVATGLPANTEFAAVLTDGTVLTTGSTSGSGEATIDVTSATNEDIVLLKPSAPIVKNASATPTGTVSERDLTFEIDVNDTDFSTAAGDNLTAELYIDGNQVSSVTLTSNGTASVTKSLTDGGSYEYYWSVSDAYGKQTNSSDFTLSVPATVYVRTEEEPHSLINNSGTAEVTIAGSGETVDRREVSNGKINMTGINIDESYIITVNVSGYHQRSAYLADVFEQSSLFLLNKSQPSVTNEFQIVDNTGQFDTRPKLVIEKIINRSLYDSSAASTYQWTVIAGERLGANQAWTTDLWHNQRYRLKIINTDGDIRSLGEYTAKTGGIVELTIGTIQWESPEGDTYKVDAYETNESGTNYIKFAYADTNDTTDSLELRIHEQGNSSNTIFQTTVTDLGNYTETVQPPHDDVTWVANYSIERAGQSNSASIPVGKPSEVPIPIDEKWLTPALYLGLIALLSATPKSSARTGAVLVVGLGIVMTWFGWVPISGPALGVAGAIALTGKAADYAEAM